jgi:hypothetical protein
LKIAVKCRQPKVRGVAGSLLEKAQKLVEHPGHAGEALTLSGALFGGYKVSDVLAHVSGTLAGIKPVVYPLH